MTAKLGLVGLCTSHPQNWVPIIRALADEKKVDVEVVAAWDSGETRHEGWSREFCEEFHIPHVIEKLEDMVSGVDAVIVHTANWDRHVEQARPFVEAGKAVLLDKPVVGNLRDARQLIDWSRQGARLTGGSSLRFTPEVREYLARPVDERGTVHTAYAGCGTDEFNYGIHAYALLAGLMGPGVRSVRYLGASAQKSLQITWNDGRIGLLTIGKGAWLPFHITAVTDKNVEQIQVDSKRIYRALLEATLPYLTGAEAKPPLTIEELLEPELTALAARVSWQSQGAQIFLDDLRLDDPGYDGHRFGSEYRTALAARRAEMLREKQKEKAS